jgi:putative DNA primase/helicase
MDRRSRHLQRRGIPTAFVWTRERAFGRGAHSHGAIRLDTIAEELVIGEGIETSASAGRLLGLPAWAAISAGNLAAGLLLPAEVRRVVIAADADPSGERAARQAALRWQREGRSVRIARPDKSGRDFNDLLRARELGHV